MLAPDLSEQIILGRDFIEKYVSEINPQAGTAVLFGEQIQIRNSLELAHTPFGRVNTVACIEVGKSVDLTVRCSPLGAVDKTVLPRISAPANLCYPGLQLAETLRSVSQDGTYIVRCWNKGSKPVDVRENFPLVVIEPVKIERSLPQSEVNYDVVIERDIPFVDRAVKNLNGKVHGVDRYALKVKIVPPAVTESADRSLPQKRIDELLNAINAPQDDPRSPPKFSQSRKGRYILIIDRPQMARPAALLWYVPLQSVELAPRGGCLRFDD